MPVFHTSNGSFCDIDLYVLFLKPIETQLSNEALEIGVIEISVQDFLFKSLGSFYDKSRPIGGPFDQFFRSVFKHFLRLEDKQWCPSCNEVLNFYHI